MQEVARGMHELTVSADPGFGRSCFSRGTPPAYIRYFAGCDLFGLHVPSNHLPVLSLFSPEQRDGVALSLWPLEPKSRGKMAPILARAPLHSHLLEVFKSALGIAEELCGQPIGDLIKGERCPIRVFQWFKILVAQAYGFDGVLQSVDLSDCFVYCCHLVCGKVRSHASTNDFARIRAVLF